MPAHPSIQVTPRIVVEREEDGRWLAKGPELPGVMAYGLSEREAIAKVEVLALRVLGEQIENGEAAPVSITVALPAAA